MATITRNRGNFFDRSGSYSRRIGLYTGPAAYVTNGDSFTAGEIALGRLDHISLSEAFGGGALYHLVYDHTNHKVLWLVGTTGLEVANGTDLSACLATFEAVGI